MTEIESVMDSIAGNLTPELITKKYREENATNPMFGHCYHPLFLPDGHRCS